MNCPKRSSEESAGQPCAECPAQSSRDRFALFINIFLFVSLIHINVGMPLGHSHAKVAEKGLFLLFLKSIWDEFSSRHNSRVNDAHKHFIYIINQLRNNTRTGHPRYKALDCICNTLKLLIKNYEYTDREIRMRDMLILGKVGLSITTSFWEKPVFK